MTTYNTGNPLGSTDPKDLYDNAQNFDDAVNSEELYWTDRFGNQRLSMFGSEENANAAIILATEQAEIAVAAVSGSVNTFFAPSKSAGDTLATGLGNGATVVVDRDETLNGVQARYTVSSGLLVLANELDAGQVTTDSGDSVQTELLKIKSSGISPVVLELRSGRDATAGNAQVTGRVTSFQQPIVVTPSVTERWRGVVRANGMHFHVPYQATNVLIHNPDTGEAYQTNFGLDLSGTNKWAGGVLGRDGRIYCVPFNAQSVLVIDPIALTASLETFGLAASAYTATSKWDGGVVAADGRIYCSPYSATTLFIIDTQNQTAQVFTSAQLGLAANAFNGSAKWSGMVSIGNSVYVTPFSASFVLLINVSAVTATLPDYGLTLSDVTKWSRSIVHGAFIYAVPFTSTDILVINHVAQTAVRTAMGATLTGSNKWRSIVSTGNKLYGIPGDATDFLVIDPLDTTASAQGTATRNTFNIYDARTPTITGSLAGGAKWAGAVVYKGTIYGAPSGSGQAGQDILMLTPSTGVALHTDLRAFIPTGASGGTKWFGGVQHPNGYIYCIPASATDFLIIKDDDPDNTDPTAVRNTLGATLASVPQKFQGGVLAGDSCIYSFPRSEETRVLKIDPSDLTSSIYGTATLSDFGGARDRETLAINQPLGSGTVDEQKWHSCVVGMDGKIYGVPYNFAKVLIMDPFAADADKLEFTNFGLSLTGASKWVGGCLHPNGKIYMAPRSATQVLVIDTNPSSATYNTAVLADFGFNLNTASNAGSTAMKWSYANLGADGRIYMMPRSARNTLVIDPNDLSVNVNGRATFETFGLDMSSFGTLTGNGYTIASKTGPDGKIYAAAVDNPAVGNFMVIDTVTRIGKFENFGLAAQLVSTNKFAGCVQTLAGRMIFVSRSFAGCVTLKLKNVPPLSKQSVLGPYLNKN